MSKKAIIVGGGFSGCTMGHMLKNKGFDVTILEKSNVLGGGCRTFFYHGHPYTFGPHHLLVHLDEMYLWEYLSKFLKLKELKHHTMTYVEMDKSFYTYPIHLDEINEMPDREKIFGELNQRQDLKNISNFEEYWINSVGKTLYNKFIHKYSKKMWGVKNNKEIDIFSFSPKGVALKKGSKQCFEGVRKIGYPIEQDGFNSYFEKCIDGCKVRFDSFVNRFDLDLKRVLVNNEWIEGDVIINTASIDFVFEYMFGELRYIGRDFLKIILPIEQVTPDPYYFIQYAGDETYTRLVEYKKMTGYQSADTLVILETPSFNNKLYPYPISSEVAKAKKYLDQLPQDVYSIGRMGKYHYDSMDDILKDCMTLIKNI